MTHKKSRRQRSKTLVVMLLPVLIIIGIMGLFLYLMGNQNDHTSKKVHHRVNQTKGDNVTFVPVIYEDNAEIINK
jgi:hypothetical protein